MEVGCTDLTRGLKTRDKLDLRIIYRLGLLQIKFACNTILVDSRLSSDSTSSSEKCRARLPISF